MILDTIHFSTRIENIYQLLWNEELEIISLRRMNISTFEKEEIVKHYDYAFKNFPLDIGNSAKENGVSIFATELFELHFELVELDGTITAEKAKELAEKRKVFDPRNHCETIENFISTLFHCLVFNYDEVLMNTMNQYYFVGINDEVKILLSILNRYKSVLKDKTKQIDIFWGIQLNKQISDLILEMLIEFIEHRLNLLTISIENINLGQELNYVENDVFSIDWNGSQQELCELILELEKKEWIAEIKDGERRKFANSITKIFNLTNTKKNEKSDPNNSFYQLLKGEYENKKRTYPFMEKENYEKKFDGIINRHKKS